MKKLTISLLAVIVAVFMAVPAMADVTPYGSVRLGTFWQTLDPATGDSDSDTVMPFGNYSRFGAKFKTGDISGVVELGLKGAEDGNTVYQRLLYGKWDMGGSTLLVGQDYCPYTHISAQVSPGFYDLENYFIGYGCLWNGRQPQIKLEMANGLYAALIEPSGTLPAGAGAGDTDVTLPKICVGYKIKGEGLMLNPGIAYNTINYNNGTYDGAVDSYFVYLNGKAAAGPVDLKFNVHFGQNLTNFGISNRTDTAKAVIAGADIIDSDCMGYYIQAAFKLDPATITVGYGYAQAENDEVGTGETDDQTSYFINAKIPIAKTFFVVPEFTIYDGGKDASGNDEDDSSYMGLMFQMNF